MARGPATRGLRVPLRPRKPGGADPRLARPAAPHAEPNPHAGRHGARLPDPLARPPARAPHVRPRVGSPVPVPRRAASRPVCALGTSPSLSRGERRHAGRGPARVPAPARSPWAPGPSGARGVAARADLARASRDSHGALRGVRAPVRPRPGAGPPADLLGAHVSVAGGFYRALERGHALGCAAVQIFVKNQLRWRARPLTDEDVRLWKAARRATGIRHAFAHASY